MSRIMPFIGLGIFIVLLVVGIIFLSYLFVIGAIIGLVLYAVAWIRMKLSQKNNPPAEKTNKTGNVYDHDQLP